MEDLLKPRLSHGKELSTQVLAKITEDEGLTQTSSYYNSPASQGRFTQKGLAVVRRSDSKRLGINLFLLGLVWCSIDQ